MTLKLPILALCLLHLATAKSLHYLFSDIETLDPFHITNDDDTTVVGSSIRETRAAPSNDGGYYKSNEGEGDGEVGYSRKKSGGGKKGYQHFDSYHKKAGDNYEFEKQDSFGHDDGGQDGAYSHRHERKAKHDQEREHLSEPEDYGHENIDEHEEDIESTTKKSKQLKENDHAELRDGVADGNGGVEAYGHDPKDYILPEKYSYGKDVEAYDF